MEKCVRFDHFLQRITDRLQAEHSKRFQVHYTVSRPEDETWPGLRGRVTQEMISKTCFAAGYAENKRTVALLCGPPLFETETCVPALKALGYAAEDIVRY